MKKEGYGGHFCRIFPLGSTSSTYEVKLRRIVDVYARTLLILISLIFVEYQYERRSRLEDISKQSGWG